MKDFNIPQGWKLVPVEPTYQMSCAFAGKNHHAMWEGSITGLKPFPQRYKDMLAVAPEPPAVGVGVKPLVWKGDSPNIYASTEFGFYEIDIYYKSKLRWSFNDGFWISDNVEEAKAAAQADYERRIMEAIEVTNG